MISEVLPKSNYLRPLISRREPRRRKLTQISSERESLITPQKDSRKTVSKSIDGGKIHIIRRSKIGKCPSRSHLYRERSENSGSKEKTATNLRKMPNPHVERHLPLCLRRQIQYGRNLSSEKSARKYRGPVINFNAGLPKVCR